MAKAIALYTGGVHFRIETAIRADGAVFQRTQERTFRGYRWNAWRATGDLLDETERANPPTTRTAGFSALRLTSPTSACINDRARWSDAGELRIRLPNTPIKPPVSGPRFFDDEQEATECLDQRGGKAIFVSLYDYRVAFGDRDDLPGPSDEWSEVSERELGLLVDPADR